MSECKLGLGRRCPCQVRTQNNEARASEFSEGIAEGRRKEREAVVAWLRDASAQGWLRKATGALADEIERGEHEKGSGE